MKDLTIQPAFRLSEVLLQRAKSNKGLSKRLRSRSKILAATATEMERVGYENMTIDGITDAAEMARSTFYLHFKSRSAAAMAVLSRYRALLRQLRPHTVRSDSNFETIHRFNRYYVGVYALNAPILAGREALMREAPALLRQRDWTNARWAQIVLRDLAKRQGSSPDIAMDPMSSLVIRATIAMVDELLREVYIYKSPSLIRKINDEDDVAELISFVWYRSIYGQTPPIHELDITANFASFFKEYDSLQKNISTDLR